ncbi:MAG TPA: type II toxin-antitoxin system Phd/YefM family antitoxin [Candidatus Polarisedimenticolaceae bacterium]|nr:type II toxin-antitoxin system Phd/YefM family antitoxin [Candidatus Polarisedimenticolaceae bacterium]
MATRYSITDARSRFPTVVKEAEGGKRVELTRNGKPVAVVVGWDAYEAMTRGRKGFGSLIKEFREWIEREKIDMGPDDPFEGVRDKSPGRKVDL